LERENFLFIITDIKLEDGSGYEILEKSKQKNVLTPVIGITGYVDELEDTYMSINFDALIRKPLHLQDFLKKLNEVNSTYFQVFFYGSFSEFREASPETSDKKMVVFTTEEYAVDVQEYLEEKQLNSFGVVVPGFIYRSNVFESGIMTMFISKKATELKLCDSASLFDSDPEGTKSHLIFYDVCTLDLDEFCDKYGKKLESNYVLGVGCGDKYLRRGPALFDKKGFHDKSCLVISTSRRIYSESFLGLKTRGKPLTVEREGDVIKKINGENAGEYYLQLYQACEKDSVSDIYQIGIKYPFGFFDEDKKLTVRIPVDASEKGFRFIGGYTPGSKSYILQYDKNRAMDKLDELLTDFRIKERIDVPVITYCYGRYIGNREMFSLFELKKIFEHFPDTNFGFLSHGEIISGKNDKYKMQNYSVILSNIEV